jgi:hypothetical protein
MPLTNKKSLTAVILVAAIVLGAAIPAVLNNIASAASLTEVSVRFDRMKVSTATTGTVCAKPTTVGVESSVTVTYPAGYTLGLAATFTVDTTTNTASWPATAAAWPGVGTASNVTGQVVTFASGDLTVGNLYCFNWINSAAVQVTATPSASNGGTVATNLDSSAFSTASIADDQVVVTASVPQSFSFALSGNTDALGSVTTGAVSTSPTPRTATVNTNAKNGWLVWAKDLNTGLTSALAAKTVASTTPGSNSTLSAGTEGYNTGVTQSQVGGSGTITVAVPFVGGALGKGGGLDATLRTLATSNGTANTAVLTLNNNAAIGVLTPAATDYTDTITIVGAGLF